MTISITKAYKLMRFKHEKQIALADDFQNTVQLRVTVSLKLLIK